MSSSSYRGARLIERNDIEQHPQIDLRDNILLIDARSCRRLDCRSKSWPAISKAACIACVISTAKQPSLAGSGTAVTLTMSSACFSAAGPRSRAWRRITPATAIPRSYRPLPDARREIDPRARAALYGEILALRPRDLPFILLVHGGHIVIIRREVTGLQVRKTGDLMLEAIGWGQSQAVSRKQ